MRRGLPSGNVTLLFTDVEGSTKLLRALGAEAYADALGAHRRIVRDACTHHNGVEVDTQGDAFFVAFPTAPDAVDAAMAITTNLDGGRIQLRIGLHSGEPLLTEEGYVGEDVHLAARVAASGHGRQVIMSGATRAQLDERLPVTALGDHRLKDIAEPVAIYQLGSGSFPPLKTISNTNLPSPPGSFVGREVELAEVRSTIANGGRLLTLTGPGGSGKTRLALEAAASLIADHRDGTFWVALAALRDPALVTDAIARTLGATDDLADHIGERTMLLVVDNLEQVIDAAPDLAELVGRCPNLTLLVTSRERLRVQGEVEYPVPPLAEPAAVSLFCERARLEPTDEIATLCVRLDNLPLAVELAAARAKALTPAQMLARLPQRLDVLRGGRDADPRQLTLRATIDWSYELLTTTEQELLRRLSVFSSCTLEAAEAVCGVELDVLQSLVEKSLVRATNGRYWMFETIRAYAGEKLRASGEGDALQRRLFESMLRLAEDVELGSRNGEWLNAVEAEHENIQVALQAAPSPALALRLAAALLDFWIWKGHVREGRVTLEALLRAAEDAPDGIRGRGALAAGEIACMHDDYPGSSAWLAEAETLCGRAGDAAGVGRLTLVRGWIAYLTGDLDAAARLLDQAVGTFRALSLGALLPRALRMQSVVENRRGNEEQASVLAEESLAGFRAQGDEVGVAMILSDMAWHAVARGEYRRGRDLAEESLATSGATARIRSDPATQHTLSLALFGLGQPARALEVAQESLRGAWDQHDVVAGSAVIDFLAALAAESGADHRAARLTGAAEGLIESAGASEAELELARLVYVAATDRARDRVGSITWREESALGRSTGFEDAVQYALEGAV